MAAVKKLQTGLLATVRKIPDRATRDILYGEAMCELDNILNSVKKVEKPAEAEVGSSEAEVEVLPGEKTKEEETETDKVEVKDDKTITKTKDGKGVKGVKKEKQRLIKQRSISTYFQGNYSVKLESLVIQFYSVLAAAPKVEPVASGPDTDTEHYEEWSEEQIHHVGPETDIVRRDLKASQADMFEESVDQTISFGGDGNGRLPDHKPEKERIKPIFFTPPTQVRHLSSTMVSEEGKLMSESQLYGSVTPASSTLVQEEAATTIKDCSSSHNHHQHLHAAPAGSCYGPALMPAHFHISAAALFPTSSCAGNIQQLTPCGAQALPVCTGQSQEKPKPKPRGKGPGPLGSYLPWQKLCRKPAKRIGSGPRSSRDSRVEDNIKRTGLGGFRSKKVPKQEKKAEDETYEEKVVRKFGLVKPWERVELAGVNAPSSSEDEDLGHRREPKFTRSLLDLSPGYVKDDDDEEEEVTEQDSAEQDVKRRKF